MNTFLFTLDPGNWQGDDLTQAVYEADVGGGCRVKWTCASFRKIYIGDEVYLMRVGEFLRGIMGSGVVSSEPHEVLHWDSNKAKEGVTIHRVELFFDVLMDAPLLSETDLKESLPEYNWFPSSSGVMIPPETAQQLGGIWNEALGALPIDHNPVDTEDPSVEPQQSSVQQDKETRRTGKVGKVKSETMQVTSTAYKRNTTVTEDVLLRANGTCEFCELPAPFISKKTGKPYLEVHHIIPLSDGGVDDEENAVAICPNCHREAHFGI